MSETPYLEDNNRKGETHGRAIFGDKEADLLTTLSPAPSQEVNDKGLEWLQNPEAPGKHVEPVLGETALTVTAEAAKEIAEVDADKTISDIQSTQLQPIAAQLELTPTAQLQLQEMANQRQLDVVATEQLKESMLANPENVKH